MWKKLSSKVLFKHPRLLVEEDEIQLQNGEKSKYLRYGYGGDGVVIVAKNDRDQVLLIREYSYVPNRKILQLPMGKVEDGESVEIAGNRELQEEVGLKAKKIEKFGYYYQNHRRSNNKGYVVVATDLFESKLDGDPEDENIEKVWVSIDKIDSLIVSGEILDTDTLTSLRVCGL